MTTRIVLPKPVVLRAQSLGEPGAAWIANLPELINHLAEQWSFKIEQIHTGGSESFVATVQCADQPRAILKIGLPGSADLTEEARIYTLAAGRGYANLIAHDKPSNALLLERLGAPLAESGASVEEQIRQICATLAQAWITPDSTDGIMTGAEKARWLSGFIAERWALLEQPCDRAIIDKALRYAEARDEAHASTDQVLVHGDAHAYNTLQVIGSNRYKFVDPDGLFAERACDLAVPMREWNEILLAGDTALMARHRCQLLAELTGVEPEPIWQWGYIERVSTGLVCLEIGMRDEGLDYLTVAQRLIDVDFRPQ
jgi:streptomycin 6-kinase